MNKKTILLVEDNSDDEILTLRAFKKNNLKTKIFVVRDGEEALDYLFHTNQYADRDPHDMPCLTLLDVQLPKMNGLEVLRRIRAREETRRMPVVILSSSSEEKDVFEGYQIGANSYVHKPVNYAQFAELIEHLGIYWLELNEAPSG